MSEDFITFEQELLNTSREAMENDNLDFITELYRTNKDNIELSKEYLLCRKEYSKYYNLLITNLCKAKLEKSSKALENKFLELLNDNQYGEESKKYYAEVILDEATKMDKLVKQLLELMNLEYGKKDFNNKEFDIRVI